MNRALMPTLLAALALGGCASTTEQARLALPAIAAPGTWQAPLPHGGRSEDLARWWSQFGDPLLSELIAAAQAVSPTLSSAQVRIAKARAAAVASGAQAAPRLDAAGSLVQGRNLPQAPTSTSASLGLQASWELDLFGGVAASGRAGAERLRGAEADWHEARVSLSAEVATAYVSLRACEAQHLQAQADADSRDETARLTDQAARAGFTAPADAALARAGAAQARSQARAQLALCDTLVKGLVELTDRPEPALRSQLTASRARLPVAPAFAPPALPAQLLTQRPDLAAASAAVHAAAADVVATRADELPRVSLSGSLALASARSSVDSLQGNLWSLGPLVVSLPLLDRGTRRAATAASEAAYDDAVVQLQGSARRALREVEAALVMLDATAGRERDVMAAAADFEAFLTAIAARQRGGLANLLDLEAARRNAVQARSALIELQRERVSAWIALYRCLGGGWNPADLVAARHRPAATSRAPNP